MLVFYLLNYIHEIIDHFTYNLHFLKYLNLITHVLFIKSSISVIPAVIVSISAGVTKLEGYGNDR